MRLTTLPDLLILCIARVRLASALITLLAGLAAIATTSGVALAQDRTIVVELVTLCGDQPAVSILQPTYSAGINGFVPFSQSVAVQASDQTVTFHLNPPTEDEYVIRRVYYEDAATGRRGQLATPDSDSVTVLLDLDRSSAGAVEPVTMTVTVDQCTKATVVRVKIATTASCSGTGGEDVKVQGGVDVRIGDKSYTSNENGVIETDLPTGTYEVTASWFDAPMSYVTLDSHLVPKAETGLTPVTLERADATLEVRIATCGEDGRAIARATVTTIASNGTVRVRRTNAVGGAFPGMKLRDGDLVTVTGDILITWEDGHTVSFTGPGQSVFRVGRGEDVPAGRTKTKAGPSVIELIRGTATFLFPSGSESKKKSAFEADTGTVALGVKGTQFTLTYDDVAELTTIAVTEGLVTVTPVGRGLPTFDLGAGQMVEVSRSDVGPVTPIGPAPPPA